MPRVNIYIRNEDQDKWQAITDKPEWLHEHLNVDILKNRVNGQEIYVVNRVAAQKAKEREELEPTYEPMEPTV